MTGPAALVPPANPHVTMEGINKNECELLGTQEINTTESVGFPGDFAFSVSGWYSVAQTT